MDLRVVRVSGVPRSLASSVGRLLLVLLAMGGLPSPASADVATRNFSVQGAQTELALAVAEHAERLRTSLAREWFGHPLPDWESPCLIEVQALELPMRGTTTFTFQRGQVCGWRMTLRGPPRTLLETLLPHEVAHVVLASHFRRAVPRWADEGLATQVEDPAELSRLRRMLDQSLSAGALMPLDQLLSVREYPDDPQALRVLYLQASSLTEFLLQAGIPRFLRFVDAAMQDQLAEGLTREYGLRDVAELERLWRAWLGEGRPALAVTESASPVDVAAVLRRMGSSAEDLVASTGE
jgi:hypothetical protein